MSEERGAISGIICFEGFYTFAELEQHLNSGKTVKLKAFCGNSPVLVVTNDHKDDEVPF